MKLTLTNDSTTNRRFILLAPAGAAPRGTFRHVEGDPGWRQELMADMQRLRGRIYLYDGAINQDELTADGRHIQPIDEESWHLLVLSSNGRVLGCTRYLQHHASTPYSRLRVRTAALAHSEQWREGLRCAVEKELENARQSGFSYVEVGGWALDETLRGSTDALRSVLFTYAWSHVMGGCLGLSMATHRNGSAAILRRIGGRPLEWDGAELPPYYDPHYKCEMEVLRFDSRLPSKKYSHIIDIMKTEIPSVPVICGHKPAEVWHSFVNRLCTVRDVTGPWVSSAVASAT
jgi:hypothetical protein